jgi:hypothetical protein
MAGSVLKSPEARFSPELPGRTRSDRASGLRSGGGGGGEASCNTVTSYFVRISQLRDQLQAIEEIIPEKELVNIVLNGLPKTWDAFTASMNTRTGYPTFEELWTCCAQEESRISTKEKSQKKDDDQAYTTKFKKFRNKKKFGSRKKPNQEKDMSKIQCFNCQKYGHYRNQCPELKKRKETHKETVAKEKEPSKKVKQG